MGKTNRTFSLTDEYNDIFERRREEQGMTVTAYFEHLIDTENKKAVAALPVETVKDNPEHLKRIAELETELEATKESYDRIKKDFNNLTAGCHNEIETLTDRIAELETHSSGAVAIDPINMSILYYIAEREGKKRNQEWTTSDVVNFFIYHRFEKGTLNGGFDSVPDRIISKLRKELENV